jgi:hypothetical protein
MVVDTWFMVQYSSIRKEKAEMTKFIAQSAGALADAEILALNLNEDRP